MKYPTVFRMELRQDENVSGRMEVTAFFGKRAPSTQGGVIVHSRAHGQGFPSNDWKKFEARVG